MVTLIPAWMITKYIRKCGVNYLSFPKLPRCNRSILENVILFHLARYMWILINVGVCGHSGLWPFPFGVVPVSGRFSLGPVQSVAVSVCGRFGFGHFGLWPLWPVTSIKNSPRSLTRDTIIDTLFTYLEDYNHHNSGKISTVHCKPWTKSIFVACFFCYLSIYNGWYRPGGAQHTWFRPAYIKATYKVQVRVYG